MAVETPVEYLDVIYATPNLPILPVQQYDHDFAPIDDSPHWMDKIISIFALSGLAGMLYFAIINSR